MKQIEIDVMVRQKQLPPLWHGAKRLTRKDVGELVPTIRKVVQIDAHIDPEAYVAELSRRLGQELRLVPKLKERKNA